MSALMAVEVLNSTAGAIRVSRLGYDGVRHYIAQVPQAKGFRFQATPNEVILATRAEDGQVIDSVQVTKSSQPVQRYYIVDRHAVSKGHGVSAGASRNANKSAAASTANLSPAKLEQQRMALDADAVGVVSTEVFASYRPRQMTALGLGILTADLKIVYMNAFADERDREHLVSRTQRTWLKQLRWRPLHCLNANIHFWIRYAAFYFRPVQRDVP
eukprot:6124856-Pleurochrysis_carterae.AAC.1